LSDKERIIEELKKYDKKIYSVSRRGTEEECTKVLFNGALKAIQEIRLIVGYKR